MFDFRLSRHTKIVYNYRMNAKELKRYELIITLGEGSIGGPDFFGKFEELIKNDYTTAFEVWEYLLTTNIDRLSDPAFSQVLEGQMFTALYGASESKFRQLIAGNSALLKLIYISSATAGSGLNLGYLTSLVLTSKIDAADEILKLVASNKNTNTDYGSRMQAIIDDVFDTYCSKNNTKVPNLNRKQTMLLLEYALKIKGANKNLLVQRIKELQ